MNLLHIRAKYSGAPASPIPNAAELLVISDDASGIIWQRDYTLAGARCEAIEAFVAARSAELEAAKEAESHLLHTLVKIPLECDSFTNLFRLYLGVREKQTRITTTLSGLKKKLMVEEMKACAESLRARS